MKSICCFLSFLVLAANLTAAFSSPSPETINNDPPPRVEKFSHDFSIPLVTEGKGVCEIVIAPGSCPIVRYAAEELQKRLLKSTGARLPIVPVPGRQALTRLYLGDQPAVRAAGIDMEKLPRDGFMVKTSGRNIYLAGKDDSALRTNSGGWGLLKERGTLNGVYAFLEKFAGVRYYFPGEIGIAVPRHSSLSVPAMTWLDRPDFPRRRTGTFGQQWFPEVPASARNEYIFQQRGESFYLPCCHGQYRLKYGDRFSKSHPEYFALRSNGERALDRNSPYFGSFCYNNQGLLDEFYRDAEAYLTGKPASSRGLKYWDPSSFQPGYFDMLPPDHYILCECPVCRKYYAEHDKADQIWEVAIKTARRLQKNRISGTVTMLAYSYYTEVPDMEIPSNMMIQVAVNGPWSLNSPKLLQKHDQRILAWQKKMGRKPWLWTYVGKCAQLNLPGLPPSTPRTVGRYFKERAAHICGAFLEAESDHQLTQYLNHYVFGKVCWDNRTDVDQLLREHNRLMFGAGAHKIGAFLDSLENIWMTRIAGNIVETHVGPQAVVPSDYEIWEKIYSPAKLAEWENLFKEALKLAAGDSEAVRRIGYFQKYILGVMQEHSARYFNISNARKNWKYQAGVFNDGEKIQIDGIPEEAPWKKITPGWLIPFGKHEIGEVSTRFKIARDQKKLYLAAVCEEPFYDKMALICSKRDDRMLWRDSGVELFLVPDSQAKTYYHFIVNAKGVVFDARQQAYGASSPNSTDWNPAVEVKTARTGKGWSMELAVPLADMPELNFDRMMVNVNRNRCVTVPARVSLYTWSPYITGFSDIEKFGRLEFNAPAEKLILDNGDFSAPLNGRVFGKWVTGDKEINQGFVAFDQKCFRAGGQSLRLTNDGKARRAVTQWLPAMKSNTCYQLNFDIRLENVQPAGKTGGILVNVAAPKNMWYPKNAYRGTMPWTSQGWRFKTGNITREHPAYICLFFFPGTGTVWFDNMQITEITE